MNEFSCWKGIVSVLAGKRLSTQTEVALSNERYLRAHPEFKQLMSQFVDHLLEEKPDDVRAAAAAFFREASDARRAATTDKER